MKTYEKNGLTFLQKNDELYVVADSWFAEIGYDKANKARWYKKNITEKYSRGDHFFYEKDHGLCVQAEVMEIVSSNLYYNQDAGNALADIISIEYHDFVKSHDWKESDFAPGGWVEEYNEYDEQFYKEHLQPKVTAALENITQTAKTPFFNSKDFLPDTLVINGKKYLSEEKYQKDTVEIQMKLDALKSMLLS